jgi:hypothetical protein
MSGGRLVNQVFPYDSGRQLLTAWMPCASVECMLLDAALRKENAELRRANEILKTASAFFAAAEVDRRLR